MDERRQYENDPIVNFEFLLKTACQFEHVSKDELEGELLVGTEVVAKRRAVAAFNTHRRGTIIVRGINQLSGIIDPFYKNECFM